MESHGPGQNKRFWTEDEDTKLIEILLEMYHEGKYYADGNFKNGYLRYIEKSMAEKLPGCDIKAKPHVESRIKTLKTHFQTVHEMLTGPNCNGFGWDVQRKMVTAKKPVWDAYLLVRYFIINFLYHFSTLFSVLLIYLFRLFAES